MVISWNAFTGTIFLPCPQCEIASEIDTPALLRAINLKSRFRCSDCGCEFELEFVRLTRSAEQANEAEGELAGKAPNNHRTED